MKPTTKQTRPAGIDSQASPKYTLPLMVLAFFLFLLPVLPQVGTYHSDERFYTDAAVYMSLHHDYLTPHYADGSLRLNKPIATYWLLMAGYALWGMTLLGARLPFLLSGCLILWLTYRISLALFARRRDGLFAAAILAGNVQFIALSLRATPDILQTLFLNLSLFGFIRLLFHEDNRQRNYLIAYLGAALAVATKGMLGIAPVVFAFVFACFLEGRRAHLRRLFNGPAMLSAVILGSAWFVAMLMQHGHQELARFYQDQVGDRLSGPKYLFLLNLKDYLWGFVRYFAPWCLVVLAGLWLCRKSLSAFVREHRRAVGFIAGWTAILLVIFSAGNISRTRYLIPAYPLLAVLCASLFTAVFQAGGIQRMWRWICRIFLGLMLVLGAALTVGGAALHWQLSMAGFLLLAAAVPCAWFMLRRHTALPPLAFAMLVLFTTASTHSLVLPVFRFVPTRQTAETVLADSGRHFPVTLWAERRLKFAGQLYLISKGRIVPIHFHAGPLPPDLDQHPLVLLTQNAMDKVSLADYTTTPCGPVTRPASFDELWRAWRTGRRRAVFDTLQEPCYLARRK